MKVNHIMKGIYRILNIENGKSYIGKSIDINRRLITHKNNLKTNKHINKHLQSAWLTHGEDKFKFETIELCENLDEREKHWIAFYKSADNKFGYNKTLGGDGGALTGEAKERMRKALLGKIKSKAAREMVSKKLKGKARPEEVRAKISKSHKGRPKAKEHNQKISSTLLGRKLSAKTKNKMSQTRKGIKQKLLTCPHCLKQGRTTMHRWHFDNCKVKNHV